MAASCHVLTVGNHPTYTFTGYEFKNYVCCTKAYMQVFIHPAGYSTGHVLIGDTFVFPIVADDSVIQGQIALNRMQRLDAKVSLGDAILVKKFIPPENFNLASLTLEVELENKYERSHPLDAVVLSKEIRKMNYTPPIMTVGQRILYKYNDIVYIFTVNQAVLEGKEKTDGIERGFVSPDTHIIFETRTSSGIQILNQEEPTSSNIFEPQEINLQPFTVVNLERCRLNGFVKCGPRHDHIYRRTSLLAEQVKVSEGSPLLTCLLEGPSGSGKTAMAATIGIESDFPYVKMISAGTMIGLSEATKRDQIVKVFEDAYKSPLSIIILDDIERLISRFTDLISQTLSVLVKELPPEGKKLLVIGTTSEVKIMESVGIRDSFTLTYHVPTLNTEDAKKVLQQLNVFSKYDVDSAAEALNDMPLKKLYTVVEMAAQGERGGSAEAIYSGRKKINISDFYDCLQEMAANC